MDTTTAIVDRYFAVWNETDADRRRELIAETWDERCRYADPVADVAGHHGIETMVSGFHEQFSGLTFVRIGAIEAHQDRLRFTWNLMPLDGERIAAGTDVAVLSPDGRLADVTGFFDQLPVLPNAVAEGATA